MATGFSNFLADGQTIQIDETYKNLTFKSKHTLVATNLISTGSPNTYDVTLTVGGLVNPVIVISAPTVRAGILSTSMSGSTGTFRFGAYSNTQSFTVYIFDEPTQDQGNSGMQVFNASGQLVFDSSKKYLKIVSSTTFTNYASAGITYPVDGRLYGYLSSGFIGYFEDYHDSYDNGTPFSVKTKGACFWNLSGGSVSPLMQQFWTSARGGVGITSPFYYEISGGTIQVVDLTGL